MKKRVVFYSERQDAASVLEMYHDKNKPSLGRTLLVLGRVSNLPTVWSNCIAGWWLGGSRDMQRLVLLCAGASLLYTGGMYLNDACDSRFDALHRSGRPIPSGAIQGRTVWILSCVFLGIGALLLALLGKTTALITLGLLGCIIFYDVVHKKTILSPVVMAACRFLLYLVAASAASAGINKETLWSAVALAAYVIGLSYLARKESSHARINPWSLLFLLTPVLIAFLLDDIGQNFKVIMLSVIFLAWIAWCLRPLLARKTGAIGQTVSGLLAGIVLLDLLVVHGIPGLMPLVFVFLFGSALLLQRIIPAT